MGVQPEVLVKRGVHFPNVYGAIGGLPPVYQSSDRGTSFSVGLSFSPRFGGGSPAVPPASSWSKMSTPCSSSSPRC